MNWSGEGIICQVQRHGDSGAIVRLLTDDVGILSGYVRGGQSRRIKPQLMIANRVAANWRARVDDQLGALTFELTHSLADVMMSDALVAAGLGWITALAAVAMPERQPYPEAHRSIIALIDSATVAGRTPRWAGALAHAELVLLSALGFGLDLTSCAATGVMDDLLWVSPKSGQAVSRGAGEGWKHRLLALPGFILTNDAAPDWPSARAALDLSGHFIARHLLDGRAERIAPAREMFLGLVARAAKAP
jgi:DNA repair protein RecO (recombination protein O)